MKKPTGLLNLLMTDLMRNEAQYLQKRRNNLFSIYLITKPNKRAAIPMIKLVMNREAEWPKN